jgi:ABC-type multidrug transport system fused ATPase/permease subunit
MKERVKRSWARYADGALRQIGRSVSYFHPDRRSIYLLVVLTGISTAVGMLQAWPLAVLIDSLAGTPPSNDAIHSWFWALLPHSTVGQIVGLALIALTLRLIQEALGMIRKMLRSRIDYRGVLRLRCDLFRKMQALHIGYHRSQPIGDGIFRLNTDTFGCMHVLGVLIGIIFALLTLLLILGVQLARSPALTLIALAAVPPLTWANFRFGRRLEQRTSAAKKADSSYTSTVHRSLTSIGLTQAFGREEDEFRIFGRDGRECVRSWLRIHKQEVAYGMTVGAILGLDGALVLGYGGYLIHQRALTPGELMVFMSYLGMMYDPICQLTGASVSLQSGLAGTARVFEVLDRPTLVMDRPDALSLPLRPRTLTLRNLTFEYTPGRTVLRGLNLTIPPGTSVGFVGASGVGKSTLLNLLPRFYDPTGGSIALDEYDLRTVKLKDLRKHIAPALQDSVILPTSISENISYGRPFASAEEVREAARLAGADDFIEALPDGYATILSEGGQNLSGGQRQRLAVARALLTGAPILVLDEPTSFQDGAHEEILRDTLRRLKGKCSVVLVSHRFATVQDCDVIYVLHGGVIAESGTHDQLIRQNGIYAQLAGARRERVSRTWLPLPSDAHAARSARV